MANAIAITLDKDAASRYNARVAAETARETGQAARPQSIDEYRSTVARMAAATPGAVTVH